MKYREVKKIQNMSMRYIKDRMKSIIGVPEG